MFYWGPHEWLCANTKETVSNNLSLNTFQRKVYTVQGLATTGEYCCEKISTRLYSKFIFTHIKAGIDVMQLFMPIIQNFFLFGVNSISLKAIG